METETTTTDQLIVHAYHTCTHLGGREYDLHPDQPTHLSLRSPELETREAAEAWAARFPKSLRFYVSSCSYGGGKPDTYAARTSNITLVANGVNGGVNETGLRRYRSAVRTADKLGLSVVFGDACVNSYRDRAAFEAAIA